MIWTGSRRAFWRIATVSLLVLAFVAPLHAASAPEPLTTNKQDDATNSMRRAFYAYDAELALNPQLKPLEENDSRTRQLLSYDSIHDQRVTAILSLPKIGKTPFPAVVLVHGSGGSKDASYLGLCSESLNRLGIATISIDSQYHGDRKRPDRSGEIQMPDSYTMRDAWIQTVVDIRRAADYLLSRPDVDPARIGFLGFSQGAMLGCVATGIDTRFSAVCLAVPGGGLVDLVKHIDNYPVLRAFWTVKVTPQVLSRVDDIASITDPIHYVGSIAPRKLLIITADHDEIIPATASAALIAAANVSAAEVKHWNSGHVLNPMAVFDVRAFFRKAFLTDMAAAN